MKAKREKKKREKDTSSVGIYVQLPKKAVYGIFIRLFKKHLVQVLRNHIQCNGMCRSSVKRWSLLFWPFFSLRGKRFTNQVSCLTSLYHLLSYLFIYPNQQCFTTNNHKSMKPRNSFYWKQKICLNQQIIWIKWFHQPYVQSGAKKCTKLQRLTEISILCTKWWNSLVLAALFLFSRKKNRKINFDK